MHSVPPVPLRQFYALRAGERTHCEVRHLR